MAKGNEGNLLQHGVETEVGDLLYAEGGRRGLHIICTHSMAPFEKTDLSSYENKALRRWLDAARQPELGPGLPAVVRAYRHCRASLSRYPNTAELLAALVGRFNLSGMLVEKNPYKFGKLHYQWQATEVESLSGSWRDHTDAFAKVTVKHPWLFTMDPMTFNRDPKREDDANLYPSDLTVLRPAFSHFLGSGQAGAITVFCFSLRRPFNKPDMFNQYDFFLEELKKLHVSLGEQGQTVFMEKFRVRRSNWDVGVLLTNSHTLIPHVQHAWSKLYPKKEKSEKNQVTTEADE